MNLKLPLPGMVICLTFTRMVLSATEPGDPLASNSAGSPEWTANQIRSNVLATGANCEAAIDLVFVVDSSWSIAGCACDAFEKMKTFARSVVAGFQAGASAAHFGVVDFSSTVVKVLPLSGDLAAVNAALGSMPFLSGGTDTASGLIQGQEELEANGRAGVAHVILLITDGHADDGEAAQAAAAQIKAAGTQVFAIGVTERINVAELRSIASSPSETHVYNVEGFDGLTGLLQTLVTNLCPPENADLSISKTDSADPVLVGDALAYTITVSNHGPAGAGGVVVQDVFPAGLRFVSATPSRGQVAGSTSPLTWNVGELANGATETLTLAVLPEAAELLCDEATVMANEPDPNPADNRAVECTTAQLPATANLVLTKTAAPDPVIAGHDLLYTVTVRNNGPAPATGVVVTDTLPAEADFISADSDRNDLARLERALTWTVGPLDSGASANLTIVLRPTAPGQICNEAAVQANEPDPAPEDNQAQACATVVAAATADLAITKIDSPDPVVAGGKLTYRVAVQNNGPAAATDVVITDALPDEAGFVLAMASQGDAVEQDGILTCRLGTLTAGSSATVEVVVRPKPPGPSQLACERAIDVVFVIDSSGSVRLSAGAFDKIRAFAKNLVGKFRVNAAGAHFGIVDFSSPWNNRLITGLSDDAATILGAIDTMPLFGNNTDIAGGLTLAATEMAAHGRPGVNHTVILLTDGKADDGPAAEQKAAEMKAAGIEIFSVGVTDSIDLPQLQRIASSPVGTHLFKVEDFDGLSAILQQLVIRVCPPAPETTLCNSASVQAAQPDPNTANNSASECTVVKSPDLLRLAIVRSGVNVIVSWPGWASSCLLESALAREMPPDWAAVPSAPALVADRLQVTEPASAAIKIYRLRSP